jgi:hypothetical protein
MATELVNYNAARKALAQARRVDEAKSIHDKARAMETYAKLANDNELLSDAIEIRMRAEVRAGELLAEMKVRGERAEGGNKNLRPGSRAVTPEKLPKLSDLGVSKMQSSRWQKLAALPKPEQEHRIKIAKEAAGAALDKASKLSRNSQPKAAKPSTMLTLVERLCMKARHEIVTMLKQLTANERKEFLRLLRFQLEDLEGSKP